MAADVCLVLSGVELALDWINGTVEISYLTAELILGGADTRASVVSMVVELMLLPVNLPPEVCELRMVRDIIDATLSPGGRMKAAVRGCRVADVVVGIIDAISVALC